MRCRIPLVVLLVLIAPPRLFAQEGRVTISGYVGPSVLSFGQVEEDGRKDIAVYNLRGTPIGDYESFRYGLTAEGQIEYRFDRDLSMNVFGVYTRATSRASFSDTAQNLSLERLITSTDVGFDINYYIPPLIHGAEASIFVGLGRMVGRAEQTTNQSHKVKSADSTITIIDQEAFAAYKKTKLYVRTGVKASIPVMADIRIVVHALYKYAPLGSLDGTLREFTLVRPHTTTIEFDFSTIDIKVGISYSFD